MRGSGLSKVRYWQEGSDHTLAPHRASAKSPRVQPAGLLADPTCAAGMRSTAAAARCTLGESTAIRVREEERDHTCGVLALASLTWDRCIGVLDRAQCVEAGSAVETDVFVERHFINYFG